MLNATSVTMVGRLVSDVETRVVPTGDKVANFRMACQERRYDKELDLWQDGDRMYVDVACWRRLADGVGASLSKGNQVVVIGRLKIDEYVTKEGAHRQRPRIDARAVGPDLALHTVHVGPPNWETSPDQLELVPSPPEQPPQRAEKPQAA
jgi:single-strand DNA-binding protein